MIVHYKPPLVPIHFIPRDHYWEVYETLEPPTGTSVWQVRGGAFIDGLYRFQGAELWSRHKPEVGFSSLDRVVTNRMWHGNVGHKELMLIVAWYPRDNPEGAQRFLSENEKVVRIWPLLDTHVSQARVRHPKAGAAHPNAPNARSLR